MPTLQRGDIVVQQVLDEQGRNPKTRPFVVVTATEEIEETGVAWGVGVTSTLPHKLTDNYVLLPWHPNKHPRTGLKKKCAAKCDWLDEIMDPANARVMGHVPAK